MHSLTELKKFFEDKGIPVGTFNGWLLKVKRDKWTMQNDEYYCNNTLVKRKEILAKYKFKKTRNKYKKVDS